MPTSIQLFPKATGCTDAVFSIVIPSWNNLPYLKNCVESIKKNSVLQHQIIVHVNEGLDGTRAWVEGQDIDYSWTIRNAGICFPVNACRSMVKTSYIMYMSDDMYVCPGWDQHLLDEIKALNTSMFFLSSTLIEPRETGNEVVIAPHDYGTNIMNFQEQRLLSEFKTLQHADWSGSSWPPHIMHVNTWDLVGGLSVEFTPGMYSDTDLAMKLYRSGVRVFKGVSASRVYHFMSKTRSNARKNKGSRQFLFKWGITTSLFNKDYLHMGSPYAHLPEFIEAVKIKRMKRWCKLTQIVQLLKK